MQRNIFRLSWEQFDSAVADLSQALRGTDATKIYGEPRGGLVLAVALSPRLGLPLTDEPDHETLWVDDIVDSGRTLSRAVACCCDFCCLISCLEPAPGFLHYYLKGTSDTWVLFPWEDPTKVEEDIERYLAKAGVGSREPKIQGELF